MGPVCRHTTSLPTKASVPGLCLWERVMGDKTSKGL